MKSDAQILGSYFYYHIPIMSARGNRPWIPQQTIDTDVDRSPLLETTVARAAPSRARKEARNVPAGTATLR